MCVHGRLIVLLSVAGVVVLALSAATPSGAAVEWEPRSSSSGLQQGSAESQSHRHDSADTGSAVRGRLRRRTKDDYEEQSNIESSISLWEWLKGRDKPEDNCMLMAIGGVASGGFLTGAFVGAGIGSIFTGPGAIVGGIVGGLVGMFGGLSVGARAGAVACENV